MKFKINVDVKTSKNVKVEEIVIKPSDKKNHYTVKVKPKKLV